MAKKRGFDFLRFSKILAAMIGLLISLMIFVMIGIIS